MEKKNPYDLSKLTETAKNDLQCYLYDLMEYLEERMDADYDDGVMVSNEEMKMLYNLNHIFGLERY